MTASRQDRLALVLTALVWPAGLVAAWRSDSWSRETKMGATLVAFLGQNAAIGAVLLEGVSRSSPLLLGLFLGAPLAAALLLYICHRRGTRISARGKPVQGHRVARRFLAGILALAGFAMYCGVGHTLLIAVRLDSGPVTVPAGAGPAELLMAAERAALLHEAGLAAWMMVSYLLLALAAHLWLPQGRKDWTSFV